MLTSCVSGSGVPKWAGCFGELGSSPRSNTSPKSWPSCGRAGHTGLEGGSAALHQLKQLPHPLSWSCHPGASSFPAPHPCLGGRLGWDNRAEPPKNMPGMKGHPNHPAEGSGCHTEILEHPKGAAWDIWEHLEGRRGLRTLGSVPGSGNARCKNEGGRWRNWFGKQVLPGELPSAVTQAGLGRGWSPGGDGNNYPLPKSGIACCLQPQRPHRSPIPLPGSSHSLWILTSTDGLDNRNIPQASRAEYP